MFHRNCCWSPVSIHLLFTSCLFVIDNGQFKEKLTIDLSYLNFAVIVSVTPNFKVIGWNRLSVTTFGIFPCMFNKRIGPFGQPSKECHILWLIFTIHLKLEQIILGIYNYELRKNWKLQYLFRRFKHVKISQISGPLP